MKTWSGVVVTTYQEKITVLANTKEEAELLMYDQAHPAGDGVNGEMLVYGMSAIESAEEISEAQQVSLPTGYRYVNDNYDQGEEK